MYDDFPFEYVGGGYFRKCGIPKGRKAETLHGQEAIDFVLAKLADARRENDELRAKLANPEHR